MEDQSQFPQQSFTVIRPNLVPTMDLRLYGSSMDPVNRRLQQKWVNPTAPAHNPEWRDVPHVEAPRDDG